MIKGKIACGFEYEIEESVLDNMELIDAIAEADENHLGVSKVIRLLLGNDQRRALYDHLRTPEGNVPIGKVKDAIVEIFQGNGQQGKN